MFDAKFQVRDPVIKSIFRKKNALDERLDLENQSVPEVVLHIGAQRTSTTTMQAWLWPLALNTHYLGRTYNFRGGNQFDYIRLPLPMMLRDHFLGRSELPEKVLEKIISDLFVSSRVMKRKVILSVEFMEITAIRKILQLLRSLQKNREKSGVEFKIICTIREPVDMIRSMFALDTFLKGRFDLSQGFDNWFRQLLDEEQSDFASLSFVASSNIAELMEAHHKYYENGADNAFPFFLENARWESWSKILSTACGSERVLFVPVPGRLSSWKVFSDILHPGPGPLLKAEIDAYYDEVFQKRPHLNAILITDEMSPERRNIEKFKLILAEGMRRFDELLGGERHAMLDAYFSETREFMKSLESGSLEAR